MINNHHNIDIHQDAHSYPVMNNPRVMNSRQLIDNLLDVITSHCIDKSVCNVYNSSMGSSTNCKYAKGKSFSFAHHNVNRLYHKLDEIRTYLHSFYPFNVYWCCETFLNNTISDQDILIEGYNIARRDRTQCVCVWGGGGLLVYIMNNIDYTRRCDLERNDIEVIWLVLIINGEKHRFLSHIDLPMSTLFRSMFGLTIWKMR